MNDSERAHENRLRRLAARKGLRLRKLRAIPGAQAYGRWWIFDQGGNRLLELGPQQFDHGLTLDEVETYLAREERTMTAREVERARIEAQVEVLDSIDEYARQLRVKPPRDAESLFPRLVDRIEHIAEAKHRRLERLSA